MSLAGVNCCSVPVTQHKQQTTQQRKAKMQDKKKDKKNIKVGDLKPKKDAKGGGSHPQAGGGGHQGTGGGGTPRPTGSFGTK
jgi:hypothetical protein